MKFIAKPKQYVVNLRCMLVEAQQCNTDEKLAASVVFSWCVLFYHLFILPPVYITTCLYYHLFILPPVYITTCLYYHLFWSSCQM